MEPFKVLTFNLFKLGGPVAADRVVDRILDLEPDVAAFQEVFNTRNTVGFRSRNARKILRRRLQGGGGSAGAGFETVWQPASGPGPFRFLLANRLRDGLLLAVRTAVWDVSLADDYSSASLNDRTFTRRVIQGLLLRPRGSDTGIAVFNTHLTVGTGDAERARRREEIGRALDFIAGVEDQHRPAASILTGDFNSVSQELAPTLLDLRPDPPFRDTWREANLEVDEREGNTIDLDNTIVRDRPPRPRDESMRIDFILLSSREPALDVTSSRVVLNERDPDTDQNLSDHYGVLTEFRWLDAGANQARR